MDMPKFVNRVKILIYNKKALFGASPYLYPFKWV